MKLVKAFKATHTGRLGSKRQVELFEGYTLSTLERIKTYGCNLLYCHMDAMFGALCVRIMTNFLHKLHKSLYKSRFIAKPTTSTTTAFNF